MIPSTSVAIVTGGSRGLGHALVQALRSAGVQVEAPTRTTVDVRDGAQVHAFVADVLHRHGHIDILINNAGWSEGLSSLEDIPEDVMNRCIDTNVKGVFHCLHAVFPIMKKQKNGFILTICSRAATRAHPLLPVYSASKFAVRGLTQAVARLCKEENLPIHCLSISPGGIDTEMRAAMFGEEDSRQQQTPMAVATIILRYLQGDLDIPDGSDVQIVQGQIDRIIPLDV
jgi:3-oxoacyl-[acyl-carrier protein] reductase